MGGTQLLAPGQSYFWSASTHAPNIVDKVVYGKVITSNRKQNENATKSTMSTKQKSQTKPKAKSKNKANQEIRINRECHFSASTKYKLYDKIYSD